LYYISVFGMIIRFLTISINLNIIESDNVLLLVFPLWFTWDYRGQRDLLDSSTHIVIPTSSTLPLISPVRCTVATWKGKGVLCRGWITPAACLAVTVALRHDIPTALCCLNILFHNYLTVRTTSRWALHIWKFNPQKCLSAPEPWSFRPASIYYSGKLATEGLKPRSASGLSDFQCHCAYRHAWIPSGQRERPIGRSTFSWDLYRGEWPVSGLVHLRGIPREESVYIGAM
jgi:hypothetical protein